MVTTPTAPAIHPHVRGADRDFPASDGGNERFIPTCVGQDRLRPREHAVGRRFIPTCVGQMAQFRSTRAPGSSPRAWGRCAAGDLVSCGYGSSPRAWGRCAKRPRSSGVAVHPHVRGADFRLASACRPRFIPTCVGQMPSTSTAAVHPHVRGADPRPMRARAVHPHVRGQIARAPWTDPPVHPHVRGADVRRACIGGGPRFIPTCVGQMPNRRHLAAGGSSPRAWGRCALELLHLALCGSSPRAWGRWSPAAAAPRTRFIPTCVGQIIPSP